MKDHEDGVSAYQAGHFRIAKDKLAACSQDQCPKIIRTDCAEMLVKVANETPSVVLAATDASGADRSDVGVTIDGEPVAEKLDGRPINLDPGEHQIRFEAADGTLHEEKIVIRQGEKNRRVTVRFEAKSGGSSEESEKPEDDSGVRDRGPTRAGKKGAPADAWIFTGLGAVALGSFAYFGLKGKSKQRDLEESCAPSCPTEDYREMKKQYLFADISLGVAVVSLGIATYLFVKPRGQKSESAERSIRFGAAPTRRGASLAVDARF